MKNKNRGHSFSKKYLNDRKINPDVIKIIKQHSSKAEITCALLFNIANNYHMQPEELGFAIDQLEISLIKCQLGLFGYKPQKKQIKPAEYVPEGLERAIRDSLTEGKLYCKTTWEIAKQLNIGKIDISSACESLNIKISACQLGAF